MKTLAIILVLVSGCFAQSMSPLQNECGKRCAGLFTVTNNTISPMTVTVDPYMISVGADKRPEFHTVNGSAEVSLSSTSARLSPKQAYTFDYKVRCVSLPCSVGFAAGMMQGHTNTGIAIRLVLMSFVYQCDKAKDCRVNILRSQGVEVATK